MRLLLKFFLFQILIFSFFNINLSAQKYISDSTIVYFGKPLTQLIPLRIDSIIDARENLKGTELKITESTKYLYIPVDFYYVLEKPLTVELKSMFSDTIENTNIYKLIIDRFEFTSQEKFIKVPLLIAQIQVYSGRKGFAKQFRGTLVYEIPGKRPKRNREIECFETLIDTWKQEFTTDLQNLPDEAKENKNYLNTNFIPAKFRTGQSAITFSSFSINNQGYSIEAALGFFDPEASRKFYRHTYFFKYSNDKRFESVEFSSRCYHQFYRFNESFVTDIYVNEGIGVNRWKDMNSYNHKLYDIVQANVGVNGGIYYMPFRKRSVFIGLVLNQDLYYIYCMGMFERSGIGITLGINF